MIFPIKALTSQCKTKSEATQADTAAFTSEHCALPEEDTAVFPIFSKE